MALSHIYCNKFSFETLDVISVWLLLSYKSSEYCVVSALLIQGMTPEHRDQTVWGLVATTIQLDSDLTYEEKPVKILEYASRVTRNKVIKFCKVQWSHHMEDEATSEREDDLRKDHPHLFSSQPESRGRDSS